MPEEHEEYEAGNSEPGEDPAVRYVIERWGQPTLSEENPDHQTLIVEGRIESVTVEITQGLRGLGGSEHDPLAVRHYAKLVTNQKHDTIIRKARAKIEDFGDNEILREVLRQLTETVRLATHEGLSLQVDLMADSPDLQEKIRQLRGGIPRKNRLRGPRKGVQTQKEVEL